MLVKSPNPMKKILFFYGPNFRTVALETLINEVKKHGYDIEVLTLSQKGDFHEKLTEMGIKWTTFPFLQAFSLKYYIKQTWYFYKYCRANHYDVVWSHLQPCNLAASIVQFFISARFIIFRHHFHAIIKQNGLAAIAQSERFIEWVTCSLAKELVVPSSEVYNGMTKYEGVDVQKVKIIPYIYNFDAYPPLSIESIKNIRKEHDCQLLLIMVSRLIPMKRHSLVFPIFNRLINEGYDIKVIIMDNGEEKESLQKYVSDNHLSNRIFFKGFVTNVLEYMAASDILMHPSFTDASSSALKEMGFLGKPVMVCQGVGDVDEYIVHNENSWVITPQDEAIKIGECIKDAYSDAHKIDVFGKKLRESVLSKFSTNEHTFSLYETKLK
jgi:glycosyltransferase involved in cell wall biosynthesis